MKITLNECAKMLRDAPSALILCHKSPDGDTLGSGYGLCYALRSMGKNVCVRCVDKIPKSLGFALGEYRDGELCEDFIITIDTADAHLMGEAHEEKYASRVSLAIDHHVSHREHAEYTLLDTSAAATAEIVLDIIDELGVELSPQMADCIFMGMTTDTGSFRFSNTTESTFLKAARLKSAGARTAEIGKAIFGTKSKTKLLVESVLFPMIEYGDNGMSAILFIPKEFESKYGATADDMADVSGLPKLVEGVRVSAVLKERADGTIKASVRADKDVNALLLCQEYGGGGHISASGFTSNLGRDELVESLCKAITNRLRVAGYI